MGIPSKERLSDIRRYAREKDLRGIAQAVDHRCILDLLDALDAMTDERDAALADRDALLENSEESAAIFAQVMKISEEPIRDCPPAFSDALKRLRSRPQGDVLVGGYVTTCTCGAEFVYGEAHDCKTYGPPRISVRMVPVAGATVTATSGLKHPDTTTDLLAENLSLRKSLSDAEATIARVQAAVRSRDAEGYNGDYDNAATAASDRGKRIVRDLVNAALAPVTK